jgi:antitoxin (DNA-binding transcriptional repressor) of toxin-antitoxin stability system
MSVADAGLHFGELVDRVSTEGLIVELQRDERVVARLSPAGSPILLQGVDYGWTHEDGVVFRVVEEFSEATDADY